VAIALLGGAPFQTTLLEDQGRLLVGKGGAFRAKRRKSN